MQKEQSSWFSPSLNKEMPIVKYGHYGFALLLVPTAAADYLEYERFQMIDVLAPLIDAGKLSVFSIDSINNDSLLNNEKLSEHNAIRHNQLNEYVFNEVVTFIRYNTRSETIHYIIGSSLGAFDAINFFWKQHDR